MGTFNFLDPRLSPKVKCASPATDNFEVDNLISANPVLRSQGFLAYSTVKPPIHIDFEVMCPIDIEYVLLETTVGSQKTNGVEISLGNSGKNLYNIGKALFESEGVVFYNGNMFSASEQCEKVNSTFYKCFLKGNRFHPLWNVSVVRISIIRTARSVPCLRRIEIWGKASRTCSASTIDTIKRLICPALKPPPSIAKIDDVTLEKWDIPDELKDSLTYEVMAIPMTLPSGNTIDQSTLEKCIATEASQGRQPSDPFTGVQFTNKQKPIFNAALKQRIDLFLLQNSHREETFQLKRTLGQSKRPIDAIEHNLVKKQKVCVAKTDDLENAIASAINNSNFIRFTSTEEAKSIDPLRCVFCKNETILYSIPCKHLYCRNCLLDLCKTRRCKKCSARFLRGDIKKCNF